MFAGNFAPAGWAFCDGQLLSIAANETLYAVIGNTYGGDQSTFALPDLRGRLPLHQGERYAIGQVGGAEAVTLAVSQLPAHNHSLTADPDPGAALSADPQGRVLATPTNLDVYRAGASSVPVNSGFIAAAGGAQPHTNLQPYLCVNFIIALFGVFPNQGG